VDLLAVSTFKAFLTGAERDQPIRARLHVFVGGLQGFVIESIPLGLFVSRRPDHGLVGISEAAAAEIRHWIGLAPDDVVENPEAQILHNRADAENIVVGTDHPPRRRPLQYPPARPQPS